MGHYKSPNDRKEFFGGRVKGRGVSGMSVLDGCFFLWDRPIMIGDDKITEG